MPPEPFPPSSGLPRAFWGPLLCALMLHGPDGSSLYVLSDSVRVIRPIDRAHHDHVARGVRSVLYTSGAPTPFGVSESAAEVLRLLRCGQSP